MNNDFIVSSLVGISWATGLIAETYFLSASSIYDAKIARTQKQITRNPRAAILRPKPLVSFVIITRDDEATIEECLQSITNSTYRNFEVTILDNCSKDATRVIVRKFIKEHPKRLLRLMAKRKRFSQEDLCSLGMRAAKGQCVVFMEPNRQLDPKDLKMAVNYSNFSDQKPFMLNTAQTNSKSFKGIVVKTKAALFTEPINKALLLRKLEPGVMSCVLFDKHQLKTAIKAKSNSPNRVISSCFRQTRRVLIVSWLGLLAYLFYLAIAQNYALPLGLGLLGIFVYAFLMILGDSKTKINDKLGTLFMLPGSLIALYVASVANCIVLVSRALFQRFYRAV